MIYGHGIDIVKVERLRKLLADQNDHFIARVFTEAERAYCNQKSDAAMYYAARFAVKEAFGKATGLGLVASADFHDLDVQHDDKGKPILVLNGRAKQVCSELEISNVHVSISHDGDYAIASVILEKDAK